MKAKPVRKPKEAVIFTSLGRDDATLPVDVTFEGEATQAKLRKTGGYYHNMRLVAPSAFELVKAVSLFRTARMIFDCPNSTLTRSSSKKASTQAYKQSSSARPKLSASSSSPKKLARASTSSTSRPKALSMLKSHSTTSAKETPKTSSPRTTPTETRTASPSWQSTKRFTTKLRPFSTPTRSASRAPPRSSTISVKPRRPCARS